MTGGESGGEERTETVLRVQDLEKELAFIRSVFEAEISGEAGGAAGGLRRCTATVGNAVLQIEETRDPRMADKPSVLVVVKDVDATHRRALEHGAVAIHEPAPGGPADREAAFEDAQGIQWQLRQTPKKMTNKEVERRLAEQRKSRM